MLVDDLVEFVWAVYGGLNHDVLSEHALLLRALLTDATDAHPLPFGERRLEQQTEVVADALE